MNKNFDGKYLVFAGEFYYPLGGFEDFVGSTNDYNVAREECWKKGNEWAHIIDKESSGKIYFRSGNSCGGELNLNE